MSNKEAYYFSHDSNARNDEKLLAVRMRHGAEGYGIYFMILERLRDDANNMSVKDYNILAFDFRVNAGIVKSVVEDFKLFEFTEDSNFFFSQRMLNNMKLKNEKSEKARLSAQKRWNRDDDIKVAHQSISDSNANAMLSISGSIAHKVKESKINQKEICNEKLPIDLPKSFKNLSRQEFYKSLKLFDNEYDKILLSNFYNYWSEPNPSGKMRFQLEKTWSTKGRLATWKSNEIKFSQNNRTEKREINNIKYPEL